jgi:aminoglycoside phosphotransferase (APT) family kinase protein
LLFADTSTGLIDFDTVTLGEPAIDLGHFTAYLRLSWAKASRGAHPERADALVDEFLAAYRDRFEDRADATIDRVAGFELLSLVRSAIHSWLKLKADRLELTAPLIRRSVERLSGTDPGPPEGSLREVR